MPQKIELDGETHEFPDDFTDDDIAAALGSGKPSTPPAPTSTVRLEGQEVMNQPGTPNYQDVFKPKDPLPKRIVDSVKAMPGKMREAGVRAGVAVGREPLKAPLKAYGAMVEAPLVVGSGMLANAAGMFSDDPEETIKSLSYQPRGELTKAGLDTVGAAMAPAAETLSSAFETAGETVGASPERSNAIGNTAMAVAPFVKGVPKGTPKPKVAETPAQVARRGGVKILPSSVDPTTGKTAGGIVGRTLEKVAGPELKESLRQKNVQTQNAQAGRAIGAPKGARMDKTTYDKLVKTEKKPYGVLANRIGKMADDAQYQTEISSLTKNTLARDAGIDKLLSDYATLGETNAQTVLNTISDLRKQGYHELNKNYQNSNPPLGEMRLAIADKLDDLLARTASEYGVEPKVVNDYLLAKRKLAKIHNVEDATSGGIVAPSELAKQGDKGAPLSGDLAEMAYVGEHFSDVVGKRPQTAVAPPVPDFVTKAANMALSPVRATARGIVGSDWYQNTMGRPGTPLGPDVPIRPDAPPPSGGIPLPPAPPTRPARPSDPRGGTKSSGAYGRMPPQLSLADELGVKGPASGEVPFKDVPEAPLADSMAGGLELAENARVQPKVPALADDMAAGLETENPLAGQSPDGPFEYGNPAVRYREPPAIEPVVGARQLLEGERGSGSQGVSHFQLADELTLADDAATPPSRGPTPPRGTPEGPAPDDVPLGEQFGIEVLPSARGPGFFEVKPPGAKTGAVVEGLDNAKSLVEDLVGDILSDEQMGSQPARQPFAPAPAVPKGRFGGQGEIEVSEIQAPRSFDPPRKASGKEMTVESDNGALILRPSGDTMRVRYAKTKEPGKGEGTKLYVKAIADVEAQGKKFASDTIVSEAASRVYDKLERMGYKVTRNEAEFDPKAKTWTSKVSTKPVFEVRSPSGQVKRSGTG